MRVYHYAMADELHAAYYESLDEEMQEIFGPPCTDLYNCRICGGLRATYRHYCAPCFHKVDDYERLATNSRRKTREAVKAGKLPHPKTLFCADCGKPATGYDHRDYHKPLDVEPVCTSCNKLRGVTKDHPFYEILMRNRKSEAHQ